VGPKTKFSFNIEMAKKREEMNKRTSSILNLISHQLDFFFNLSNEVNQAK